MNKVIKSLMLTLALASGLGIQSNTLHAAKAPLAWLGKCGCFCRCDMRLGQLWFKAVKERRITIVKMLITLGIDVDLQNSDGNTALMLALLHTGFNPRYLEMVKLLIGAGADIITKQNCNGMTALMYGVQIAPSCEAISLLIDELYSRDALCMSYSADEFQAPLEIFQHVIAPFLSLLGTEDNVGRGVCWHVENSVNLTPEQKAALLKKLKPEQHDCHAHKSPLALALEAGDFETVRYLIEKGADFSPEQNNGHDVRRLFMQRVRLLESIKMRRRPVRIAHSVCGICRDDNDGTSLFFEPCGHCFHKTCAQNYLKIKRECPICHAGIRIISQQNQPAEDEKKDA